MADIAERLRLYAQQFEDQHAPDHITLAMRAGADEIERKDAEIASLLTLLADERTESMRLRAALKPLACTCDRANGDACSRAEANCAFWNARAALDGRT